MKEKEDYWERLFKGYERSGLSQEDFCHEQGIPVAKFKYQWRKKPHKPETQSILNKPSSFEPIVISNKNVDEQGPVASQTIRFCRKKIRAGLQSVLSGARSALI